MYAVSFLWQFPYVMAIAWNVAARGEVRDDLVFTALAKASPAPVVLGSPRLGDGIGKSPASAFCGSIFRDVVVDRQDS